MRISDWSSDVCSSDLLAGALVATAGQALFPAGGNIKGLRAQDQGFTTSQAGLDIPLVIGTQKVAGNVIWAGPLVEHKKSQSAKGGGPKATRSEEHTSELQSLMRISYAVFCLKKKKRYKIHTLRTTNIRYTQQ